MAARAMLSAFEILNFKGEPPRRRCGRKPAAVSAVQTATQAMYLGALDQYQWRSAKEIAARVKRTTAAVSVYMRGAKITPLVRRKLVAVGNVRHFVWRLKQPNNTAPLR